MAINAPTSPSPLPLQQQVQANPIQAPAQPATTQSGLQSLPQLRPYYALQPYYGALQQQPQLQMPQYDDPTLQSIRDRLAAVQQSSPLLSGAATPHPQSVIARQQSRMSPGQIVEAAGQGLWQQEVVQPVQDYLRTWQTNPGQAVLETLGGAAVVGGIIGLEALTGGAATPFIFGAMAALAAPSIAQGWAQEVMDPSDAHLVQALVSTGAGALSVGSPVRAFRGMASARSLLEGALAARKDITTTDQAAGLLIGRREGLRGQVRTGVPLQQQLQVFATDTDALVDQLRAAGANLDEPKDTASVFVAARRVQDSLRTRLQAAMDAGDAEKAQSIRVQIHDHAKNELAPAMLATAHEHLFLPFTPYSHVPLAPVAGAPAELQAALDEHEGAIRGLLREVHSGNSLQGLHEPATRIESVLEQGALDRAAGTAWDMANRVLSRVEDMARSVGLDGLNDSRIEGLLQALEEPEKWQALVGSDLGHAMFAQKLRNISDMMTAGELRFGTIAQALQGRIAHYFQGVAGATEAEPVGMFSSWLRMPTGSRSRFWKVASDDEGNVAFEGKTRAEIIDQLRKQTEFYEATHEHRQLYTAGRTRIDSLRRSFGQHAGALKRAQAEGNAAAAKAAQAKLDEVLVRAHNEIGKLAPELVSMGLKDLKKIRRAAPATHELVTGGEALRQMIARHLTRMHQAVIGEGLRSHADMNMQRLSTIFTETPTKTWGAAMALPSFATRHELPDILPETVFLGQSRNAGTVEENARKLGYFIAHPAIGSPRDLHYRPALYARGELANNIQQASASASSAEAQHGILGALYNLGNVSKRFIMYSPLFHFMNVAGRGIAFVMNDPAVAGSAFKAAGELRKDSEAYYALLEEAGSAGMVHANKWNVSAHLHRLQREEDGQPHFLGALRNFGRAIDDFHMEHAERGLWNAVDHLQLAGYLYAKTRFTERGVDAVEARRLAAQYANTLGGMTNPLYMSRLWRHVKSQVWFAPSYWATFLHALESTLPGASRLSSFMAKAGGGRFVRASAVPLKAISDRNRRELVRAQRSWMVTYLSTAAVASDMLNVMFSGHHLWENEQGRMMDIDVTNLTGTSDVDAQHPTPKRAYITAMPMFRQAIDVANAIGLGHDYGFAHQFSDPVWQQQDALHKTEMSLGALADGIRGEAAGKTAQVPQAAYGALAGESLTARLGQNVQSKIDRPAALLSLVPNGYQIQRLLKTYQENATGDQASPGELLKDATLSTLASFSGLPSIYHMGVETPPIDDDAYQHWQDQRNAIHDRLLADSRAVFAGTLSPQEYARKKHDELTRQNQLNLDTWGDNSPGSSLASAYANLSKQFGLDDQTLTTDQWYERYDAFQPAWEQLLQSASPSTRAAWFEHSQAQWTDADYLEWEAQQLKQALAASIDGQGGAYIRAFQSQLFRLKPTLTDSEYQEMQDADPVFSAYHSLLTSMGQTSALGAFVNAFSSPYSRTVVLPPGFSQGEAQALAEHTGQTVVRSEEAQALSQQARQVAQDPAVAQAGGDPAASAEFQQQAAGAIQAAQAGAQ